METEVLGVVNVATYATGDCFDKETADLCELKLKSDKQFLNIISKRDILVAQIPIVLPRQRGITRTVPEVPGRVYGHVVAWHPM